MNLRFLETNPYSLTNPSLDNFRFFEELRFPNPQYFVPNLFKVGGSRPVAFYSFNLGRVRIGELIRFSMPVITIEFNYKIMVTDKSIYTKFIVKQMLGKVTNSQTFQERIPPLFIFIWAFTVLLSRVLFSQFFKLVRILITTFIRTKGNIRQFVPRWRPFELLQANLTSMCNSYGSLTHPFNSARVGAEARSSVSKFIWTPVKSLIASLTSFVNSVSPGFKETLSGAVNFFAFCMPCTSGRGAEKSVAIMAKAFLHFCFSGLIKTFLGTVNLDQISGRTWGNFIAVAANKISTGTTLRWPAHFLFLSESMILRMSSGTEMPNFLASVFNHSNCGSVKPIICLTNANGIPPYYLKYTVSIPKNTY